MKIYFLKMPDYTFKMLNLKDAWFKKNYLIWKEVRIENIG